MRHLLLRLTLVSLFGLFHTVQANAEKVVFLGPRAIQIPFHGPTIETLQLQSLTPHHSTWRTHLNASFPISNSSEGSSTWIFLDELVNGQRYEVRVCWAAIQPTSFTLETFELAHVFDTPELIASLAEYSSLRIASIDVNKDVSDALKLKQTSPEERSVLLLKIDATADFFSTNQTLMNDVPPVFVDVILDPFILNILPWSLQYTSIYLVALVVLSLYLGRHVATQLHNVAAASEDKKSM